MVTLFSKIKKAFSNSGVSGLITNTKSYPRMGTTELLRGYGEMPWLHSVIDRMSDAAASVTWRAYVERRSGKVKQNRRLQASGMEIRKAGLDRLAKQGALEEIESNPILDLLNFGNGYHSGMVSRKLFQAYYDMTGDAVFLKDRNGLRTPTALWSIPPIWIRSMPTPNKPVLEISFSNWHQMIPKEEIVWMNNPNLEKPYGFGSGKGQTLGDELQSDEYASKHVKLWFINRARPDLLISGEGLSKEDTDRLEQRWYEKAQGYWNLYKPFFMRTKVDVKEIGQSFQNMQLVDLRRFLRDMFLQVNHVPPEVMGIIENSNRATIEAAEYIFAKWCIVPRLELQRATFQEQLVPDFDDRIILDYDSPINEDKDFHLKVQQAAPWAFDVDEWRGLAGGEDLPDERGKVFMMPFSAIPSRWPSSGEDSPKPQQEQPKQIKSVINKQIQREDIDVLVNQVAEQDIFDPMKIVIRDTLSSFAQALLDDLGVGISFNLQDPKVQEYINQRAFDKVKNLTNQTTKDQLRETMLEGYGEGETIDQLAERISDVFAEAQGPRAWTIARTENVSAANFGSYEGMVQAGIEKKEWLATRDDNVRDEHLALDGQVVSIDEPFVAPGGETAMYPGDFGVAALDINCRCTHLPVIGERSIFNTEEKRVQRWKSFEAERMPHERALRQAIKRGFTTQENKVMAELRRLAG